MLLDTCFLIDLQKEFRRGRAGPAGHFLEKHADIPFSVSVVSVLEFLEGFEDPGDGEVCLVPYRRVEVDWEIAARAARIRRALRLSGNLIGDFDILIAATALSLGLPLVTDNGGHFGSVPGLEVIAYREG